MPPPSPSAAPKVDLDEHLKKLSASPYFHGLRCRAHVEEVLKERGEFLVRMPKGKKNEVILSLCMGASANPKFLHLPLTFNADTKSWELQLLYRKPVKVLKASNRSTIEVGNNAKLAGRNTIEATSVRNSRASSAVKRKQQSSSFRTIDDFIEEYKKRPLRGNVILTKFVKRPSWLISPTQLKWSIKDFLGKGYYCQVIKGKYTGKNNRIATVAIKMLHEEESNPPVSDDQKDESRDSMFKEAAIMSKCRYKYIAVCYGVQCDIAPVMIVMEYCPGGSLELHLQREKENITEGERTVYCFEAARGMRYLHHNNIIHRDLATRNCLISEKGVIKISDFGLSCIVEQNGGPSNLDKIKNIPLRWMAPETLSKTPAFSTKSDIWAFGVLAYEVFNLGIKPWPEEENLKKISHLIRHGPMPDIPERTPPPMRDLIQQCWNETAAERPEFREIVSEIVKMPKIFPKLKFPKIEEFSLNRLTGVYREDGVSISTDEAAAEKDIVAVSIYDEGNAPAYPVIEYQETLCRDSPESAESLKRKTKKPKKSQAERRQ